MRYGLPGLLLLVAGIAANLVRILRAELPEDLRAARSGHVIALVGTFVALSTVHVWGSTAALILFYLGAGCWLSTGPAAAEAEAPAAAGTRPGRPAGPARRRSAAGRLAGGDRGRAGGASPPADQGGAAGPPARAIFETAVMTVRPQVSAREDRRCLRW